MVKNLKFWQFAVVILFLFMILSAFWNVRFEYAHQLYQLLALPVRVPLVAIRNNVRKTSTSFENQQKLLDDNKELKAKLHASRKLLDELDELRKQNQRLTKLLKFSKDERQTEAMVAEIIGRDPNPLRMTLLINRGKRAGIGRDDPVIVPEGVIGRIVEVYRNTSRVLLLQDIQSSIGSMIKRNRAMGDTLGQGRGLLNLRNLPHDLPVQTGDLVITSGMSTFYPKGLRIGTVVSHKQVPGQLYKEVSLRPSADAMRCEEVLVLKRLKPVMHFLGNMGP